MRPAFHEEEAERGRLQRLSLRQPLTDWQADRLAYLDFLAANRGFALYRASAGRRALITCTQVRHHRKAAA